jgi:hypothetical protein
MNKSLLWINPSMTCLGDRLLDTMLIATYGKILNSNVYFPWVDCPFTIGQSNPTYNYNNNDNRSWDKVRFEDYRFENFTQYFNLPLNVKINESCEPDYFFEDVLGGCVSPTLFYEKYLSNICDFKHFNNTFNEVIKQFTPTEKLQALVKDLVTPKVSVHLRRTDKINVAGDYSTFITFEGLDSLNKMTKDVINLFYNDYDNFYFSSDDAIVKTEYENLYKNHIPHKTNCLDIEKTYIDLYMLSKSEYIILSQVHSNFSVFASYLNNTKLVYLYDKCLITDQKFNESENFIHYKNLIL